MAAMKTVLLAAGAATRLRPLTEHTPKCLLDVAGRSILARALANLVAAGLDDVVIVTGFQAEKIRAAVATGFPGLRVTWVHNAEWATTNNSVSLLLAAPAVAAQPFVLLDSDIVFEPGVLGAVLGAPHGDCLALRTGHVGAEEIKVETDARGRVRAIGKQVPVERAAGESVGIERFSAAGGAAMFAHLEGRVRGRGLAHEWYEASWQEWIEHGGELWAVPVPEHFCAEIDTVEDLESVGLEIARREAARR
jgi:choline kinase